MNLAPRSGFNPSRGLTMTASSTSSPQQLKLTNRSCLRSASLLNATTACGGDFLPAATINSRTCLRCCVDSHAAGGCAIKKVLFAPFRFGGAHIIIFWPVSSDRPIPTKKRQQRTDGAAEKGNNNGCGERKLSHVTLRARR